MNNDFSSDHILSAYVRLNEFDWGGKREPEDDSDDPDDLKGALDGFPEEGEETEN